MRKIPHTERDPDSRADTQTEKEIKNSVTCHMSLTPTATDPPLASSPTMHSRSLSLGK